MLRILKLSLVIIVIVCFGLGVYSSGSRVWAATTEPAGACDCPDCAKPQDEVHDEQEHGDHDDHDADDEGGHDQEAEEIDHSGHDHEADSLDAEADEDDHAGHDHAVNVPEGDHADTEDEHGHDAHSEAIKLDAETERLIDIKTIQVQAGTLASTIRLTGRIRMDQDKLAHVVPLTSGIVRKVNAKIGDRVRKDEILAWIESAELAQAKVRYLDIQAEIGCCAMNLTRAQAIHDSTQKLIDLLKSNPDLDELRTVGSLEMGENRSALIKAYAEYTIAKSSYEREKPLYEQKVTSQEEYLNAENRYKKAEAEYLSVKDVIQFQIQQNLMEVAADQNRQEIALKGAERALYVLGQTAADIRRLDVMAANGNGSKKPAENPCPDPNCETCRKKAELAVAVGDVSADYQKLGWYPLRAAFDGTIIDKHVTLGERLSEDVVAFTMADLDSVWVDFDVFTTDMAFVRKGQAVSISIGRETIEAALIFVSPVLNSQTRTATARAVLDNTNGGLYPGQFVTGQVSGKASSAKLVVPKDAVQSLGEEKIVFIQDADGYELRHVSVGQSGTSQIEIVSGLEAGETVVTSGAFELKSKIVTSTLGSHAGHGH